MKKLIALACMGIAVIVTSPAFAGGQQDKMKGCNAEAKGMKSGERNAFMSKCLKKDYVLKSGAADKIDAKPAAGTTAKTKQQDKMKTCNAEAASKALKGDERKKFMSSCLKN